MTEINETQIADEIKNIVKSRGIYKKAIITSVISKDNEIWKNVFTKITLTNDGKKILDKLDYDDFILNKISIDIEDFINLLNDFTVNEILKIQNLPEIKIEARYDRFFYKPYIQSNDNWLKNDWAGNVYNFDMSDNFRGNSGSGPLVSPLFPHFPDRESAIQYFFGIDIRNFNRGNVLFFLPNYHIKIENITISSEHIDLEIIKNGISQEEIIGKLYYEKDDLIKINDFEIDDNHKVINIDFIPDVISIYLLRKNGEVLDFRKIYSKYPSAASDNVTIEIKENDIKELIKQGENQNVEFKKQLNKEKGEFLESIVAFANTKGGAVIIGVDDNSNIIGHGPENIESVIFNTIRSHCEPFIEPDVKEVKINERPIIVVRINEGNNKPYNLKDKGVYVRKGSTDRIANRIELDEFYSNKKKTRWDI